MKPFIRYAVLSLLILSTAASVAAQGFGRGGGRGFGRGPGAGRGGPNGGGGPIAAHGHDERHDEDRDVFHFLLTNHQAIKRTVTELENGVETLTESDKPEVADKIKEHVSWMEHRIKETNPIRMRDPLFRELFQHTDKIEMKHEDTAKGVRVIETSADPYVAKLIKAHAKAVTGFVERGFTEAMKNHAVPDSEPVGIATPVSPVIKGHGQVVKLPAAAHQPRDGARIVVDVTRGGDPAKLNPGIEKLAKYLNIYQGAGKQDASVTMAVVLHGEATLSVLNADAYAKQFGGKGNPNFDLLHQLHEAGVEIYVCGQSLIQKGAKPDDVLVFADTAVSALTTLVNLQADGYSYIPLGK
ncbi:MAG: DsrE family protein [Rubripirellula sp.]|nr:DsrE family protein [Rubripirellula sp.]